MKLKAVSGMMLTLLFIGMLTLAFNIQTVKSDWTWTETIYIRADGSIDPPDAPMITYDNVIYTLTDNITSSAHGIVVERDNIVVDGAGYTIQGTGAMGWAGIYLKSRSNVTIKNTRITTFYLGIYPYASSHNSISENNITNNSQGISIDSSNSNSISRNSITNNNWGIALGASSNNNISGNTITNNTVGVYLTSYENHNNKFWHNNFIDNTQQVYNMYAIPKSIWDDGYPSGGNYWSDYTGEDLDGDGIGDTPYVIDAGNQDRYPLIQPWSLPPEIRVIRVPDDYLTIQAAIHAANPGDTILVAAGTYYEHVTIDKSLTLIGEDPNTTIIDGGGAGTVVHTLADYANVSGFTIQNGACGIWPHSNGNVISGNIIRNNNEFGIAIWGSSGNVISGNIIRNNDEFGIAIYDGSADNIVKDNVITYTHIWVGIWLYHSDGNVISGNTVTKNEWGINIQYSVGNTLRDNDMSDNTYNFGVVGAPYLSNFIQDIDTSNTVNGKPIYYWVNQHNKQIPADAGYVAVINSTNITVKDVDLTNNNQGVLLVSTNNSTIKNVNASHNYCGIAFWDSVNNTISDNAVTNNYYGISLGGTSGNNIIYHNNFIDNTIQAESYPSANTWDDGYPSGGNYWSDYTGVDVKSGPYQNETGSDGIGDSPYTIDANNQDNYPLMTPWTPTPQVITPTVDLNPNTLNLRSKGKWITCYIELPEGYNVSDIDISTVMLDDTIPVSLLDVPALEPVPTEIGDHDNDTIPDLMVKFNRTELTSYIYHVLGIKYGDVTLSISGSLTDGTPFEGSDTIKVIFVGDVNDDGSIDSTDLGIFGVAWSNNPYNPDCDLNCDGAIDSTDYGFLATNYGATVP